MNRNYNRGNKISNHEDFFSHNRITISTAFIGTPAFTGFAILVMLAAVASIIYCFIAYTVAATIVLTVLVCLGVGGGVLWFINTCRAHHASTQAKISHAQSQDIRNNVVQAGDFMSFIYDPHSRTYTPHVVRFINEHRHYGNDPMQPRAAYDEDDAVWEKVNE